MPASASTLCADCSTRLGEGEAKCFTVCESCWDKHYSEVSRMLNAAEPMSGDASRRAGERDAAQLYEPPATVLDTCPQCGCKYHVANPARAASAPPPERAAPTERCLHVTKGWACSMPKNHAGEHETPLPQTTASVEPMTCPCGSLMVLHRERRVVRWGSRQLEAEIEDEWFQCPSCGEGIYTTALARQRERRILKALGHAAPPRADGRAETDAIELAAFVAFATRRDMHGRFVHDGAADAAAEWNALPERVKREECEAAREVIATLRATPAANTESDHGNPTA